jgi:hypothetical protein
MHYLKTSITTFDDIVDVCSLSNTLWDALHSGVVELFGVLICISQGLA